jgi:hypothetical protein
VVPAGRVSSNIMMVSPVSRPRFVIAFNLVGTADIIIDYYHGNQVGLATLAGELGATYVIPIVYAPVLMITHVAAFYLLARSGHIPVSHRRVTRAA